MALKCVKRSVARVTKFMELFAAGWLSLVCALRRIRAILHIHGHALICQEVWRFWEADECLACRMACDYNYMSSRKVTTTFGRQEEVNLIYLHLVPNR